MGDDRTVRGAFDRDGRVVSDHHLLRELIGARHAHGAIDGVDGDAHALRLAGGGERPGARLPRDQGGRASGRRAPGSGKRGGPGILVGRASVVMRASERAAGGERGEGGGEENVATMMHAPSRYGGL